MGGVCGEAVSLWASRQSARRAASLVHRPSPHGTPTVGPFPYTLALAAQQHTWWVFVALKPPFARLAMSPSAPHRAFAHAGSNAPAGRCTSGRTRQSVAWPNPRCSTARASWTLNALVCCLRRRRATLAIFLSLAMENSFFVHPYHSGKNARVCNYFAVQICRAASSHSRAAKDDSRFVDGARRQSGGCEMLFACITAKLANFRYVLDLWPLSCMNS